MYYHCVENENIHEEAHSVFHTECFIKTAKPNEFNSGPLNMNSKWNLIIHLIKTNENRVYVYWKTSQWMILIYNIQSMSWNRNVLYRVFNSGNQLFSSYKNNTNSAVDFS